MLSAELKRKLRGGEVSLGGWLTMAHVSIAEIVAGAGFEWVVIDTEHTAIDVSETLRLIVAVERAGSVPLVRVAAVDPVQIKVVMDSGAAGVLVPGVNSRADAERAVGSVKYPPTGFRGVGLARAHGYGAAFDEYFRRNNEDSVVIVQIEHHAAVDSIEDILNVPGIDATLIGPYDLSASLGLAGQLDHPTVRAATDRVVEATARRGLAPGIHLIHPERILGELRASVANGYRFLALGTDALVLGESYRSLYRDARAILGAQVS